jgi:gliding motility-associated protein GldC
MLVDQYHYRAHQAASPVCLLLSHYLSRIILKMAKSSIVIDVELDENRIPQSIEWNASDQSAERAQQAKAVMLSLWDGADKSALRIDLWTQKMMVDEMADFYYQTLMTMADTYERATKQTDLVNDKRTFAKEFYRKFQELQMKENKA